MKKMMHVLSILVLGSMVLAACGTPATPVATEEPPVPTEAPATAAPTEPPAPAWEGPKGALVAFPASAAPNLDGVADDAVWADAEAIEIVFDASKAVFKGCKGLKDIKVKDNVTVEYDVKLGRNIALAITKGK